MGKPHYARTGTYRCVQRRDASARVGPFALFTAPPAKTPPPVAEATVSRHLDETDRQTVHALMTGARDTELNTDSEFRGRGSVEILNRRSLSRGESLNEPRTNYRVTDLLKEPVDRPVHSL